MHSQAIGPVSEDSTSANPTILFHSAALPGRAEASVRAAPGARWRLGARGNTCRPLRSDDSRTDVEAAASSAPAREEVATLSFETFFNVTVGPNPNYPNPPGARGWNACCAYCGRQGVGGMHMRLGALLRRVQAP